MNLDQVWAVISKKSDLIPNEYYLSPVHEQELLLSGITKADACFAGIFSATSQQAMDLVGYEQSGIVFLYFTEKDELVQYRGKANIKRIFARLKPDNNNGKTKYLSPENSGCKIYLPRCADIDWIGKNENFVPMDLAITEGEKKALSCCVNAQVPCLGLGGINSYRTTNIGKSLGFLEDNLNLAAMKTVTIIPDSDIVYNKNVFYGCESMIENILENYARKSLSKAKHLARNLFYILLPCLDGEKTGIDDLIYKLSGDDFLNLFKRKLTAAMIAEDKKNDDFVVKPMLVAEPLGDGSKKTKAVDEINEAFSLRSTMIELSMVNRYKYCSARGWMEYEPKDRIYKPLGKGFKFIHLLSNIMDDYKWKNRDIKISINMEAGFTSKFATDFAEWDVDDNIVFANGIYNLRDKTFSKESNSGKLLSRMLPYDYDPSAECPEFDKWLRFTYSDPVGEVWEPNEGRIQFTKCLMRFMLSKMKNFASPIEKIVLAWGAPGTSKGTFLEIIRQVVGPDNVGQWVPKTLTNPNHLTAMLNKTVSICSDLKGKLTSEISGQMTQIVSNEPVGVKRLWKDPIDVRLCTTLIAASNAFHLGDDASSEGLLRRAAILPHKRKPKTVDPELKERLVAEASGIWNSLMTIDLDDAINYINSYSKGNDNISALTDSALKNNTMYNWMNEAPAADWCMCETERLIPIHLHYVRYSSWTSSCRLEPLSSVAFKDELVMLGCEMIISIDPGNGRQSIAVSIPKIEFVDRKVLLRI